MNEKETAQDLDKLGAKLDSGDIWYEALVDLHRWFAEAVAKRDMMQVKQVLDLMERLELI